MQCILLDSKVGVDEQVFTCHISSLPDCTAQQQLGASKYLAQLQMKYADQQSDQGKLQIDKCTTCSVCCWIVKLLLLLKCLSNTWTNRVTKVNFGLTRTACVHWCTILLHSKVLLLMNKYLPARISFSLSLTDCTAQQQLGAKYLAQLQRKYADQQSDQGQL